MSGKTISLCQGKGSLAHNNRTFHPKNVDSLRTPDNVTFVKEPIAETYEKLFGAAVERYNAKQKRSDRKIKTGYFEYQFNHKVSQSVVTSSDKRKSFYEDVVQIGTKDDTGVGTADAAIAKAALTEYMNGFQERNPNFHVFNAVLHMDEATPHLHIDYVPVGHYTRGIDTQNGIAQALKEMGYGYGKDAIARWRKSEDEVLRKICEAYGIELAAPQQSRGSKTVEAYKEEKRLEEKLAPLMALEKIADETEIPYKKALSKGNVVISKADLDKISEEKKAAAVQVEMARQETERNAEERKRLEEEKRSVEDFKAETDEQYCSALALYERQSNINRILEHTEDENRKLRRNNKSLSDKVSSQEEKEKSMQSELDESREAVRERDKTIGELRTENKEKTTLLAEQDEKLEAFEALYNNACEVGEYACSKLGFNFDKCLDMRIKNYRTSYIFGDEQTRNRAR